jgi:hypothetical protein
MNYTVLGSFEAKTNTAKKKSSSAKSSSTKSRGRSEYYITSNLSATSLTTEIGSKRALQNTSFVNHCWHSCKTGSQHMNKWFKPVLAFNTNSTNKALKQSMRHLNTTTHWNPRTQWPLFYHHRCQDYCFPWVFALALEAKWCTQLQLDAQNLASLGAGMVPSGSGLTCHVIP